MLMGNVDKRKCEICEGDEQPTGRDSLYLWQPWRGMPDGRDLPGRERLARSATLFAQSSKGGLAVGGRCTSARARRHDRN